MTQLVRSRMHSFQINEVFEPKLRERIYFPWLEMKPTTRRGTQLESRRDVTRISANGCVIGHDHVIFFYEPLSLSKPTHQPTFGRSRNDTSRFSHSRMWGFLKTEALEPRYPSCDRNYCLSSNPVFLIFWRYKMTAETSLLSKYLSASKCLEHLHASTKKTVYLLQRNSLHYFTNKSS
jgi:hypothetical protein